MTFASFELVALVWEPIASPLKIGGGAAVLAALSLFAYARVYSQAPKASLVLLAMRLAVIAATLTLMLGPSREVAESPTDERPQLTILVDTSESMLTADCGEASRIQCVADELLTAEQLRSLQSRFGVDVRGFDEQVRPLSLTRLRQSAASVATGRSTHLAEAVRSVVAGAADASGGELLLVVSDGRDTEDAPVQPVAALAASRGVPVYAVGVGGTGAAVDAALLAVPLQDAVLPGEPGGIRVKVYHSGLDGERAVVQLKSDNGESQEVPVELKAGEVGEAQFTFSREDSGQHAFEVALQPVSGETELTNNSQTVFIEVMKERIRVLALEGEPFWDSKFLAQSLRKDGQVELTQITQVGAARQETIVTRNEATNPGVPESVEEWSRYDVVILGRGLERLLSPASAEGLRRFVSESGGHVVLSRGEAWNRATPEGQRLAATLSVLEPVVWGTATQENLPLTLTSPTGAGSWLAATKVGVDPESALARLPGFERMTSVQREKSNAIVLARAAVAGGPGDDPPAFTRMAYGRGQVVGILGEGLWRWSLLSPELSDLRGFYDTFWSNLVRWLALGGDFQPGQQVSLQLSQTGVRLGDELTLDVAYKQAPPGGEPPRLRLRDAAGKEQTLALHRLPGQTPRYRASWKPALTGVHEAAVEAPGMTPPSLSKKFNVYEVDLERLQTAANLPALRTLAEESGGQMFEADELSNLFDQLDRHRRAMLTPPRREYVWDRGLIMVLLLSWAGAEWLIRRAAGLW